MAVLITTCPGQALVPECPQGWPSTLSEEELSNGTPRALVSLTAHSGFVQRWAVILAAGPQVHCSPKS